MYIDFDRCYMQEEYEVESTASTADTLLLTVDHDFGSARGAAAAAAGYKSLWLPDGWEDELDPPCAEGTVTGGACVAVAAPSADARRPSASASGVSSPEQT